MKTETKAVLMGCVFAVLSQGAMAQINNKPFQFKNSPAGIGMSDGGKQAIINESLYGHTPDNMIRGVNGQLLSVEEIRGKSALVRFNGTNDVIPGYKGRSYRFDNQAMGVGVFNAFFTQDSGRSSSYASASPAFLYNNINTWTGRVAAEGTFMEHVYAGAGQDSIDAWTGQVTVLPQY